MWKDVFCHQECACLTPVPGVMLLLTAGMLSQSGKREWGAGPAFCTRCPQQFLVHCKQLNRSNLFLILEAGSWVYLITDKRVYYLGGKENREGCVISWNGRGLRPWAFTWFGNDPDSSAFKERAACPSWPGIRGIPLPVNKWCFWGSCIRSGSPGVLPVSPPGLRNWGSPRLFKVSFPCKHKESWLRPVEVPVGSQGSTIWKT